MLLAEPDRQNCDRNSAIGMNIIGWNKPGTHEKTEGHHS